jgi:hypothetical protein
MAGFFLMIRTCDNILSITIPVIKILFIKKPQIGRLKAFMIFGSKIRILRGNFAHQLKGTISIWFFNIWALGSSRHFYYFPVSIRTWQPVLSVAMP